VDGGEIIITLYHRERAQGLKMVDEKAPDKCNWSPFVKICRRERVISYVLSPLAL
jgi:hypothetical protein